MNRIDLYLIQCQVPDPVIKENEDEDEAESTHTPPSPEEVKALISYLRSHKVNPVVVGSVGIMHHLTVAAHKFRPTVDLDLFVDRPLPYPPKGWRRDEDSPGVTSWISPTGGYVDFLEAGHEFPGGSVNPSKVAADASFTEYPVATTVELLRLKLNSFRAKDMSDAVELAKAKGLPDDKAFGKLNPTQRENLDLLKQWVAHFK